MLYHLIVLQDLQHPDGRVFMVGHDAQQLSRHEAAQLLSEYPEHFAPGNQATEQLLAELKQG